MAAYYNEIEPFAAAWLRELIARNLIAPGEVDERNIVDVQPADLVGFTQCHFFAGIGVWSYALRRAGWPDDRAVWTGSCPCQPFSSAGRGDGFDDKRHLWPEFFRLIRERRPGECFGEQVANGAGLAWLDAVSADLEGAGYAFAAADLCAAGVGAPHLRQRLYFVAVAPGSGWSAQSERPTPTHGRTSQEPRRLCDSGFVGVAGEPGLEGHRGNGDDRNEPRRLGTLASRPTPTAGAARRMGNPGGDRDQQYARELPGHEGQHEVGAANGDHAPVTPGATRGFWSDADWIPCADGKARPAEPGTFPLAHGIAGRVGRLRGYGNAIVAPVAEAFIEAYLDVIGQ